MTSKTYILFPFIIFHRILLNVRKVFERSNDIEERKTKFIWNCSFLKKYYNYN
jgi:hypothetical protein